MHLPALIKAGSRWNASFPAVCDLDEDSAAAYAVELGARETFTDAAAMLDAVKPDGVAVLTQQEVSPGLITLAAERRIPFIVEKPPAPDAGTHRRLIETAAGLPHIVAYNRRYAPYLLQAKKWLEGLAPQEVTCLFSRFRRREPDFSGTAVHAIDTTLYLTRSPAAVLDIEAVSAGRVLNYYISGRTADGTRLSIHITPDTASAQEHYIVRSAERSVLVRFPHPGVIDIPGSVELHEGNELRDLRRPEDFGIGEDDLPALAGIVSEHTRFFRLIRGEAESISTLESSLQTQQIREEISRLASGRENARRHLEF